jgi:cell division septation protein DedD
MNPLVRALATTALNAVPELRSQLHVGAYRLSSKGRWEETPASRRARRAAFVALGKHIARLQFKVVAWAINRLPNAPQLIEMGSGLDPLNWIHAAGPNTGQYAVVVECSSAAQQANVEAQLDSASIPHSHPLTAAQWWATSGSAQFPGATEATWEIAEAFAMQWSTQLGRLIGGAGQVADFLTVLKSVIQTRQAAVNEVDS